jgi:hypothetical protein
LNTNLAQDGKNDRDVLVPKLDLNPAWLPMKATFLLPSNNEIGHRVVFQDAITRNLAVERAPSGRSLDIWHGSSLGSSPFHPLSVRDTSGWTTLQRESTEWGDGQGVMFQRKNCQLGVTQVEGLKLIPPKTFLEVTPSHESIQVR